MGVLVQNIDWATKLLTWRDFPCFYADLPGFVFFCVCVRKRGIFFARMGEKKSWPFLAPKPVF